MANRDVNITTKEVADFADVDPATVRRWVEKGLLVPAVVTLGGHYRFSRVDVEALLIPSREASA